MSEFRKITSQGRIVIPTEMLEEMKLEVGETVKMSVVLKDGARHIRLEKAQ